jgi:hypothetical protein
MSSMDELVSDLAAIATAVTLSAPHNGFERQNGAVALWWTSTTDSRQAKMGKREFTFLVASFDSANVDSCQLAPHYGSQKRGGDSAPTQR